MNNALTNTGFLLLFLFLISSPQLHAQQTSVGVPPSFQSDLPLDRSIPVQTVPALDRSRLEAEDRQRPGYVRFAAPVNVNYSLDQDGTWADLPNGDRIWRLQLKADQALGLFLVYKDFYLPMGARLFVYNPDRSQVLGAYTYRNNTNGKFLTGMIQGEEAILEYIEPAYVKGQGRIHIDRVFQAYNKDHMEASDYPFQVHGTDDFGESLSCHININCPEGNDWQVHKRAVVRMLRVFEEGMGYCTGTLINTTRQDGTPYVLSAFHCIAGFTPILDLWRFDFNYESADCSNPANEPAFASILGCEDVSGREESDFLLLKLLRGVPSSVNPYFLGWNRDSLVVSQASTGIHHPQGDIKKISRENGPSQVYQQSIFWNNNVTTPARHHYLVQFDEGTFENGSSGSAMLNEDGLIVGQLHGGFSSCTQFRAFYGRFSKSWDAGSQPSTRLKEWLDPDNTGAMTVGHYDPPPSVTISGIVKMPDDRPINAVKIYLTGDQQDSTITSLDGLFSFEVPSGGSYSLQAEKRINPKNGVSGFDMVFISKHALGIEPLPTPYGLMAGDVNLNGSASGFDMVLISKLVLSIQPDFPSGLSWRFVDDGLKTLNNVAGDQTGLEFIGVKMGDTSGNADPTK